MTAFQWGGLYVIRKDELWKGADSFWHDSQLPSDWSDTAAMTTCVWKLYVIQNDQLWRVDPKDGSYVKWETGTDAKWEHTAAMASLDGDDGWKLCIVQDDRLWEVAP